MLYVENNYELFFQLNAEEKMVLSFEEPIEQWVPCDNVPIIFSQPNRELLVSVQFIQNSMHLLITLLSKALKNKLFLHKSITKNIGYLWNEELQRKPGLVYTTLEKNDYWVGLHNLLWSTPDSISPIVSSWLYNDFNGAIVLEITPSYPWHFIEPKTDESYVSYEQWAKTYAPLVIRTIPHDIALLWINQAQKILDQIEKNIEE